MISTILPVHWKAFLKKIKTPELEFEEVLYMIQEFLKPVFETVIEERKFFGQWSCSDRYWHTK